MANLSNINNILRVSSSGVGLNKNNTGPSELDIESSGADMIDMTRTGQKTYRFAISGASAFSLFDVAANADRFVINTSGNVGIGTNSPNAKLEIITTRTGTPSDDTNIKVTDDTAQAADVGGSINFTGKYTDAGVVLSGSPFIRASKKNATTGDYGYGLKFGVRATASGTNNVAMTIDSDSNVGIGRNDPGYPLDVNGIIRSKPLTQAANVSGKLILASDLNSVTQIGGVIGTISFTSDDSDAGADFEVGKIEVVNQNPYGLRNDMTFTTRDQNTVSEKMRIQWDGNVGIQNTSPGALLDVGETIHANTTGIDVTGVNCIGLNTSDNHNWFPYTDGNNYYSADNHTFRGGTNNGPNYMFINSSGNVGIGTTSPNNLLNLSRNVANGDVATYIQNFNADVGSTNETASVKFAHGNDGDIGYVGAKVVCGKEGDFETSIANIKGNLQFYTASGISLDSDVNNIERMRIDSNGYVTIKNNAGVDSASLTFSNSDIGIGINQSIGYLNFYSNDGSTSSLGGVGGISVKSEEAFNTSFTPTYMSFYTHQRTNNNGTSLGNVTERMRISSNGAIGIGGANYGAAGEVLTSNGNAAPSWQAAGGGGSAWPQEKFAEYTIDSTTSNILIATMNSTTWHGNELAGCLKFTINASDYIQVSYITVSTFLSGSNQWFFKGNSEMTTHNSGTNPATYVFAFAGNNGSFGTTCTLKINRVANTSNYTKVNVLVQAVSSPDMFILN